MVVFRLESLWEVAVVKSPDQEHKELMLLFTETEEKNQEVSQYQLRAEQWGQKEDHLHVDDSLVWIYSFSASY